MTSGIRSRAGRVEAPLEHVAVDDHGARAPRRPGSRCSQGRVSTSSAPAATARRPPRRAGPGRCGARTCASSSSIVRAPGGRRSRHRASAGSRRVLGGHVQQPLAQADRDRGDAGRDGRDQEGAVGAGHVDDLAGDRGADGDAQPERRADPGERLGDRRPRHEHLGEGERADQRRRDGDPGEDDERDHHPDVVRPAAAGRCSTVSSTSTPASRRRSGSRQCTVPQPMPLAIEPSASPAMSTPDMRPGAHLVGEGDQRDLQRAEDRADRGADHEQHPQPGRPHRRRAVAALVRRRAAARCGAGRRTAGCRPWPG